MSAEIVVRGGTVFDGTGAPGRAADVAIGVPRDELNVDGAEPGVLMPELGMLGGFVRIGSAS